MNIQQPFCATYTFILVLCIRTRKLGEGGEYEVYNNAYSLILVETKRKRHLCRYPHELGHEHHSYELARVNITGLGVYISVRVCLANQEKILVSLSNEKSFPTHVPAMIGCLVLVNNCLE